LFCDYPKNYNFGFEAAKNTSTTENASKITYNFLPEIFEEKFCLLSVETLPLEASTLLFLLTRQHMGVARTAH